LAQVEQNSCEMNVRPSSKTFSAVGLDCRNNFDAAKFLMPMFARGRKTLTRDHSLPPAKIEGLAEPELEMLHSAANYSY
jgi:hypothetical protein